MSAGLGNLPFVEDATWGGGIPELTPAACALCRDHAANGGECPGRADGPHAICYAPIANVPGDLAAFGENELNVDPPHPDGSARSTGPVRTPADPADPCGQAPGNAAAPTPPRTYPRPFTSQGGPAPSVLPPKIPPKIPPRHASGFVRGALVAVIVAAVGVTLAAAWASTDYTEPKAFEAQIKNHKTEADPSPRAARISWRASAPGRSDFSALAAQSTPCGVEQMAAHQAHNLEVAGSSPAPAISPAAERQRASGARGFRRLLDAMRPVESAGDDRAVGDHGRSRGPYQIGMAYWTDGCQFGGVRWDYLSLVWSRPHCRQVIRWYWRRYAAEAFGRLAAGCGTIGDMEVLARVHNGGPDGHLKRATLDYWRKVRAVMAKAEAMRI